MRSAGSRGLVDHDSSYDQIHPMKSFRASLIVGHCDCGQVIASLWGVGLAQGPRRSYFFLGFLLLPWLLSLLIYLGKTVAKFGDICLTVPFNFGV